MPETCDSGTSPQVIEIKSSHGLRIDFCGGQRWVGCQVDGYEHAKWFGDDTAFNGDWRGVDIGRRLPAAFVLGHLGTNRPLLERTKLALAFPTKWRRAVEDIDRGSWYSWAVHARFRPGA